MRKLFYVCLCMGAAMLAISCQDDDNEVAKKYQVTLTAQANGSDISTLSDFQIQLTNAAGEVIKLTQDENSEFVYSGKVIAGTYNAQASASNDEFNFFGSKVISVSDKDAAKALPSSSSKSSSQVYDVYIGLPFSSTLAEVSETSSTSTPTIS